ncbi:Uncharacterised protein [Mycobacteroides abscessus subsp. massiliense]|uniref:hypothetical protein n=1 Tax=Mycobacteroides abscessus TaxID=36809 RepID=UPI0009A72A42|nr:hypothetical protein [Mycobacteroides abscessus]SKS09867.1 Uncharacterised protein [Mycobacteroides abscessus subsp. massiliense]
MTATELRCVDIQHELDAEDDTPEEDLVEIGVTIGHLIGVAFEVSETTGTPVPEFNTDPSWFGGCYLEIAEELGYKPTLAGDWWIDAPRWAA